ncbi:hypothetical protein E1263_40465 [Kribbella antibiotica]|uniref:Uncharacterized protein n=1 Tax=Kribbella antibiotica TaxID=190195 RepID=A0A4R4YJR5_9ACTN|nr:hypothetical protein [Kribbella antibiotica]TDD44580.1 hypothetical protein E1263_40465 [Kribbella antibiotica]
MRRIIAVAIGTALVVAGCSGEPESSKSLAPATVTTPTEQPTPTPTPTPEPPSTTPTTASLSPVGYKKAIANSETNLVRGVQRVMNAPTLEAFDQARAQLEDAIRNQRQALGDLEPPAAAGTGHEAALIAFDRYAASVTTNLATSGETKTGCGLPKAPAVRLYQAKTGIRTSIVELSKEVNRSLGKGINYGLRMTPPALTPPPQMTGRGSNGQIIQRAGSRGYGLLQITNNGSADVVVVVAASVPRQPQASIYVRHGSKTNLRGIRGSYYVFFKSGSAWDGVSRQFTEDCSFSKYDNRFDGKYNWTITLSPVIGGNASTSKVDPF